MSDSKTNLSIDELADEAENSTPSESPKMEVSAEESQAILRNLSGDNKWTILQQYLIELYADGKLKQSHGQRFPTQRELQELLKRKIEFEHSDDMKVRTALLNCVPTTRTIRRWIKIEGWEEDVWKIMAKTGLYPQEEIAAIINAQKREALKGDVNSAKLVLTLAGRYDEKGQTNDEKFNKYKEFFEATVKKNNQS